MKILIFPLTKIIYYLMKSLHFILINFKVFPNNFNYLYFFDAKFYIFEFFI